MYVYAHVHAQVQYIYTRSKSRVNVVIRQRSQTKLHGEHAYIDAYARAYTHASSNKYVRMCSVQHLVPENRTPDKLIDMPCIRQSFLHIPSSLESIGRIVAKKLHCTWLSVSAALSKRR